MNRRLILAVAVPVVVGTGLFLYTPGLGDTLESEPPAKTECQYDTTAEELVFEIQTGRIDDDSFAGVWVYVGDELARVSGPDGRSDTGAWVIDGDVGDVADYPLERGSKITVYGVDPDDNVSVVPVAEHGSTDTLIGTATPASDCAPA